MKQIYCLRFIKLNSDILFIALNISLHYMTNFYNLENPRLTRGEYWLLESVVELQVPVNLLVYEVLDQDLNKEAHGMNRGLLIETMFNLLSNGLIELYQSEPFKKTEMPLESTYENIIHGLDEKSDLWKTPKTIYGLTKLGGQVWELFAKPDWNRFMDEWDIDCAEEGKQKCVIVGSNERLIKNYFSSLNSDSIAVNKETVQWSVLEPFKATYWKTLPKGFKIEFEYTEIDDNEQNMIDYGWVSRFRMPFPNWYYWK